MSSDTHISKVRQYLSRQGWETTTTQVQEGVVLFKGTRADSEPSTCAGLVVTAPETTTTTTHLEYLVKTCRENQISNALLSHTVGISNDARRAADNYDIEVIDSNQLGGTAGGLDQGSLSTGTQPPTQSSSGSQGVSDILSQSSTQTRLVNGVGIFAVAGIGFGLTSTLSARLLLDGSAFGQLLGFTLILFVLAVMLFSGPVFGVITGLLAARDISETRESMITAAATGTIGYVVMTVLGAVITLTFLPSSDSGETSDPEPNGEETGGSELQLLEVGELVVPLVVMAIPVGIVAAGVVYVRHR